MITIGKMQAVHYNAVVNMVDGKEYDEVEDAIEAASKQYKYRVEICYSPLGFDGVVFFNTVADVHAIVDKHIDAVWSNLFPFIKEYTELGEEEFAKQYREIYEENYYEGETPVDILNEYTYEQSKKRVTVGNDECTITLMHADGTLASDGWLAQEGFISKEEINDGYKNIEAEIDDAIANGKRLVAKGGRLVFA